MFPYEEYDYESLLHNTDAIDPESPAALYALAQFCRSGKGCQISHEAYRCYLQRAADCGSAKAKAELDATPPRACGKSSLPPFLDRQATATLSLPGRRSG